MRPGAPRALTGLPGLRSSLPGLPRPPSRLPPRLPRASRGLPSPWPSSRLPWVSPRPPPPALPRLPPAGALRRRLSRSGVAASPPRPAAARSPRLRGGSGRVSGDAGGRRTETQTRQRSWRQRRFQRPGSPSSGVALRGSLERLAARSGLVRGRREAGVGGLRAARDDRGARPGKCEEGDDGSPWGDARAGGRRTRWPADCPGRSPSRRRG